MGQAMGADFSGVKVHTDSQSDQLNQSIQARAFTTGQDVFFRQGAYDPGSRGGQELIAHELTHVVQQSDTAIMRKEVDNPILQRKILIGDKKSQMTVEDLSKTGQSESINNILKDWIKDDLDRGYRDWIEAIKFAQDELAKEYNGSIESLAALLTKGLAGAGLFKDEFLLDVLAKSFKGDLEKAKDCLKNNKWPHTVVSPPPPDASIDLMEALEAIPVRYDYVFIGAGATTAYYILNNIDNLKGKSILAIGPDQPWAGERGPGKINHPMSQIVPDKPPEKGKELAERTSFAEWTESVLKLEGLKIQREPSRIQRKPYLDEGYYKIAFEEVDKPPIKAKNVILAIGIGPHAKPEGYGEIAESNKGVPKDEMEEISLPRVMSLDEFQVSADKLKTTFKSFFNKNSAKPVMILVGPNAGIDAVTTYARKLTEFADLKWIAKALKDIPFLKGTDNAKGKEFAEQLNGDLITDRFKSVAIDKEKVVATTEKSAVTGALLIYALGPEPNFLDQFLPDGQDAKGLEPIYDRSNRISSARDRVDSGNELDQGSIVDRIKDWAKNELETQNPEIKEEELSKKLNLENINLLANLYSNLTLRGKNEPAPDFGRKILPQDSMEASVVGLQVPSKKKDNDPSFQILGGSAYRLAEKVSYQHHSESISRIIEASESQDNKNEELISLAKKIGESVKKIETLGEEVFSLLTSRKEEDKKSGAEKQKTLNLALEEITIMQIEMQEKMKVNDNTAKSLSPIPRYVQSLINSIKGFNAKDNPSNPFKASTHMNEIASTHPINVALGDQLTSVMSQVGVASEQLQSTTEKNSGKLGEDYVKSEEYQNKKEKFEEQRNLIVNDATDIAMFIASAYPAIPPVVANGITRQIIWDRRYGHGAKAVPSYDIENDKADTTPQFNYQEEWKDKLKQLDSLSQKIFN
jgi:hypothetical protein